MVILNSEIVNKKSSTGYPVQKNTKSTKSKIYNRVSNSNPKNSETEERVIKYDRSIIGNCGGTHCNERIVKKCSNTLVYSFSKE